MDTTYTTTTFKFDDILPVSTVTSHSGNYVNSLPITISGTSNDPGNGSGINNLYLELKNSDGKYWSGASWEASEQQIPISPPYNNWSIGGSGWNGAWEDGKTYYIYTRAQDNATNYEFGGFSVLKGWFIYDISRPTATITYPVTNGYVSQSGRVSGVCADNAPGKVGKATCKDKEGRQPILSKREWLG